MLNLKLIKFKINNFLEKIQEHNISEFAAQCAYYIILSFIPFIIILLTLIQYIGIDKENLYFAIQTIVPQSMNQTIIGIVQEVYSKSVGTISISLLFIIWSAGKGFYSLCKGLQEIYENKKKVSYIFLKVRAIICTILFILLIILALTLMVFGKILNDFMKDRLNSINIFDFIFEIRDILVIIALFIFLILVYQFIPNSTNKLKNQIPGAIIASIGWIVISKIFSIYLTLFKGFSIIYGSLTTIVLIMMWVYFCIYIILIGAEVNHIIIKNKINR